MFLYVANLYMESTPQLARDVHSPSLAEMGVEGKKRKLTIGMQMKDLVFFFFFFNFQIRIFQSLAIL